MAIKKINTDLQIEAGLLDGDGNSGTSNQILISTGTGIDWVDGSGSSIIGGPYLPLSAGSSYPLTGKLYAQDDIYISGEHVVKNIDTNLYLDSASGYNVLLRPGGSEKVRIQANGNVGIGVTNPGRKLSVAGSIEGKIQAQNYLEFKKTATSVSGRLVLALNSTLTLQMQQQYKEFKVQQIQL